MTPPEADLAALAGALSATSEQYRSEVVAQSYEATVESGEWHTAGMFSWFKYAKRVAAVLAERGYALAANPEPARDGLRCDFDCDACRAEPDHPFKDEWAFQRSMSGGNPAAGKPIPPDQPCFVCDVKFAAHGAALPDEALRTIHDLARETLATYDRLKESGWVMADLPHEAEVRAILGQHVAGCGTSTDPRAESGCYGCPCHCHAALSATTETTDHE